jgi:site-specific DNA recombinase
VLSDFGKAKVDPNRVAAYIRWSTEDQGEGHTLQVQREHCMGVFREHGWTWNESRVFIDAGYSGTVMDRPALTQLRKAIRHRLVDCVVVYRLDRLSRRTSDTLVLIQDEWDGVCHFVSATEPISTLNGMSDIVLPLLSTVGEMDRNRIVSNTRAGKYAAAAKGKPMGKLAYGYRFVGSTDNVEIDLIEGEVVKRIFRDYLNGIGQNSITRQLNMEKIPSPQGRTWSQVTIGNLLKNEAYVGRLLYAVKVINPRKRRHRDEPRYLPGQQPIVVEDAYPRLISDEEFAAAMRLRKDRADKKKGRRGLTSPFLLSRLVKCAQCGFTLVGVRSSAGQTYYACQGSTRHRADCDCRMLRQDGFEERVLAEVRRESAVDNREPLMAMYRQQRDEVIVQVRSKLQAVEAEHNRIQAAKKKWVAAFEQGTINPAVVNNRLTELAAQEGEAKAALDEATRALRLAELQAGDIDEAALAKAVDSLDVWDDITHEQQKHLLRFFVREITAYVAPNGEKQMTILFNTKSLGSHT